MVQLVQILSQATFAPAQKDSSCEAVEQFVMVIFLVLSLGALIGKSGFRFSIFKVKTKSKIGF